MKDIRPYLTRSRLIGWPLLALFIIYIYSMLIFPFVHGDWYHVQAVWDRWQSLNAAMIALGSGVVFFSTNLYVAERRRANEARAARAFISHQLSFLVGKCNENIVALIPILDWQRQVEDNRFTAQEEPPIHSYSPFGEKFFPYFKDSIELDVPDFGAALSEILQYLQVAEVRLKDLNREVRPDLPMPISTYYLVSQVFYLIKIKAKLLQLFDYARGKEGVFTQDDLAREDIVNAFRTIDGFNFENHTEIVRAFDRRWPEEGA